MVRRGRWDAALKQGGRHFKSSCEAATVAERKYACREGHGRRMLDLGAVRGELTSPAASCPSLQAAEAAPRSAPESVGAAGAVGGVRWPQGALREPRVSRGGPTLATSVARASSSSNAAASSSEHEGRGAAECACVAPAASIRDELSRRRRRSAMGATSQRWPGATSPPQA